MRVDDADPIVRFYRHEGTDARGRRLAEILAWDDARLEAVHDYIQWLFPLPEPSAFNPHAPLLGEATIHAFHHDAALRTRLGLSLDRMLAFYGLAASAHDGPLAIGEGPDFPAKSRIWLHPGNHNHLRLTRILTCLRLLGLEDQSRALLACLQRIAADHPHAIPASTVGYWRSAGERRL